MYKRIIAVVLALVMLFSVTALAADSSEARTDLTAAELASIAQLPAVKAYEILMDSFSTSTSTGQILYPDGYGGSYINDQNKLVIKIVEGYSSYQLALEALLQGHPVVFATCTYSMNELVEYQSEAETYAEYMIGSYINQENSVVRLVATSDESATLSQCLSASRSRSITALPYEIIELDVDEENTTVSTEEELAPVATGLDSVNSTITLIGGDPILKAYNSDPLLLSAYGTLCIAGRYNGNNGYVLTAGHVADGTSTVDLYLGYDHESPLENIYDSYTYGERNSGDIGILRYDTTVYTASNQVYTSSIGNVAYYYNQTTVPEGFYVHKYGQTTGLTFGLVSGGSGYSYTSEGNTPIEDIIPVTSETGSYMNLGGDSGGPVWCYQDDGSRVLLGVVSGNGKEGSAYYMYYTPIHQAVQIGFSPHNMTATSTLYQDLEE